MSFHLFLCVPAGAQSARDTVATLRVSVRSASDRIEGAFVRTGATATVTNERGEVTLRLPPATHTVIVGRLGFTPDTLLVSLRSGHDTTVMVLLKEQAAALSSVVVSATRELRRVSDAPTKVEVLEREEVEEKTAMNPSSVAMLLNETSGVRVVATSPSLGGANVRVQGMRGRYTQMLSDGLPLFGFSTEGLGLLQIPPLDLQRVEVIKGTASALYGPTALAGVVNFVARRPVPSQPEREFLANQTSRDGSDLLFWNADSRDSTFGHTVLASVHRQSRQDVNGDQWADLPAYERIVARPRAYWTPTETQSVFVTSGFTAEDREGGGRVPMGQVTDQKQKTKSGDLGASYTLLAARSTLVSAKASATRQWRRLAIGSANDRDQRSTIFAEVSASKTYRTVDLVAGLASQHDEYVSPTATWLDYSYSSNGVFVQNTWTPTDAFGVTSSARLDAHNVFGTFLSPRVSARYRIRGSWNVRASGGSGVYTPTPFTEETEELAPSRIRTPARLHAERARGVSIDGGGSIGAIEVNGSAYTSAIEWPVMLQPLASGDVSVVNGPAPTRTRGFEAFARFKEEPLIVTATYAFLRATEIDVESGSRRGVPLTPHHSGGLVVVLEEETGARLGIEGYYVGTQPLADNPFRSVSRPYVLLGTMAQWPLGQALIFVNGENLLGVRQTRYDPLLLPAPGPGGRLTTDAWAPLEGRMLNIGVRLRLTAPAALKKQS